MVKMKNRIFGNDMWVHESRVQEYLAKGHQLAEKPKEKPKKTRKR